MTRKNIKGDLKMLNMREIIDYGPCYVAAINCPADGIDLLRKATLFDVYDGTTHESLHGTILPIQ